MRANDGDTIVLSAGAVRQTIGGQSFIGYGYNGQVPGPLIWAAQGATVHVRYQNRINWPTSVHWHGVRIDNRSDGAVGLTQNAVAPGAIAWPEDGQFPDEERARILATTPLARIGSPEDIARAVNFLACAPYVTGQILAVDGGRSIFI